MKRLILRAALMVLSLAAVLSLASCSEKAGVMSLKITDDEGYAFFSGEIELPGANLLALLTETAEKENLSLVTDEEEKNIVSIQGLSTVNDERKYGVWTITINGEEIALPPAEITPEAGDEITLSYSATRIVTCTVSFFGPGSEEAVQTEVIENFGAGTKTPLAEYLRYLLVNRGIELEMNADESGLYSYSGIAEKTENGISYRWICCINGERIYNIGESEVPDGAEIEIRYTAE